MTALERYWKEPTRAGFAALLRNHQSAVFQAAWRVLGDTSAAEDVVQEVFVDLLHEKTSDVRSTRGFLVWRALTLARRHLRSEMRRRRREEEAMRRGLQAGTLTPEDRMTVQEEIERLPAAVRRPLTLFYYGGLTRDEVARELGVSRRTVAERLSEGRSRLRERLVERVPAFLPIAADGILLSARFRPSRRLRRTLRSAAASLPGLLPPALLLLPLKVKIAVSAAAVVAAALGAGSVLWRAPAGAPLMTDASDERGSPRPDPEGAPARGPAASPAPAAAPRADPTRPEPSDALRASGFRRTDFTLRGRLVDAFTREPVRGQKVAAGFDWWLPDAERPSAMTGADGGFTIRGSASWWNGTLVVERPGSIRVRRAIRRWGLEDETIDAGDVELYPASHVEVRVLDASGKPVDGARVLAHNPPGGADGGRFAWGGTARREVSLGTTGADGRLVYSMLRPGPYWIAAGKDGLLPGVTETPRVFAMGRNPPVVVRLPPAERLRVRVLDARGTPCPGIVVDPTIPFDATEADPRLEAIDLDELLGTSRTDTDGVAVLPCGSYPLELWVRVPGRKAQTVEVAPGEEEKTVVLEAAVPAEREPVTVAGRVLCEGAPVELFSVCESLTDGPFSFEVLAQLVPRKGEFRVRLHPGRHKLFVASVEFLESTLELDVRGGSGLEDLTVELARGWALEGRVIALEDGRGVDRAKIELVPGSKEPQGPYDERYAFTDRHGRFRVTGMGPGTYGVHIEGESCGSLWRNRWLEVDGPRNDLVFAVPKRTALEIRARDDGGIPYSDLEFTVYAAGEMARVLAEGDFFAFHRGGTQSQVAAHEYRAVDVEPGIPFQVNFRSRVLTPYLSPPIVLEPGEVRRLDVTLSARPAVRGRVLFPDGSPAADATVAIEYENPPPHEAPEDAFGLPPGDWRTRYASADSDGRFWIGGCLPGSAICAARADRHAETRVPVEIPEGDGPPPLAIVLGRGLAASGVVTDPGGRPIPDAEVMSDHPGRLSAARTDALGRFTLVGLEPEQSGRLWARKPGWYDPEPFSTRFVAGRTDIRIVIARGALVGGRVVDSAGDPVTSFEAMLLAPRRRDGSPEVRDGRFAFDAAPPGKYELLVLAEELGAARVPLELAAGDAEDDLLVRLEPLVEIGGRVFSSGGPLGGARVRLLDPLALGAIVPESQLGVLATAISARDGTFTLRAGNIFPLDLHASAPGHSTWSQSVASAGEAMRAAARIDLTPGYTIHGRVAGLDASAGGRVHSVIAFAGSRVVSGKADDDGAYQIAGLLPGTYRVAWSIGLSESFLQLGRTAELRGEDLEIDLSAGTAVLEGRILGPEGAELHASVVFCARRDGRIAAMSPASAGRFRLEGLLPGEYSLVARQKDTGSARLDRVVIDADGAKAEVLVEIAAGVPTRLTVEGDPAGAPAFLIEESGLPASQALDLRGGALDLGRVAPGRHWLAVLDPRFPSGIAGPAAVYPIETDPGAPSAAVHLRKGAPLSIRVTSREGRPLAGATVVVRGADLPSGPASDSLLVLSTTGTTGATGRLTLDCPWQGKYRVMAELDGRSSDAMVILGSEPVEVSLSIVDP